MFYERSFSEKFFVSIVFYSKGVYKTVKKNKNQKFVYKFSMKDRFPEKYSEDRINGGVQKR